MKIQAQKLHAVADIPRNAAIQPISSQFNLVQASTPNEIWNLPCDLTRTRRKNL